MTRLGEHLRRWQQWKRRSIRSLAREMGLDHSTLTNVINGTTHPNLPTWKKIETWLLELQP